MKCRSVAFWMVGMVLVFGWSCAKRPAPIETPEAISTQELVARVKARSSFFRSYQAKLQIAGQSPKGSFRFQAALAANPPDAFRLEAFTNWGQTAGVFLVQKADARLWIPSEKVVYRAAHAEVLVQHFLGLSVPMEILGASLIGAVPGDQLSSLQVHREHYGWRATSDFKALNSEVSWQFLAAPPALKAITVTGKGLGYDIGYEPQVELDMNSTPSRILFTSSQWQMEVKVSQMRINPDLPSAIFNIAFPQGTREVDLDAGK